MKLLDDLKLAICPVVNYKAVGATYSDAKSALGRSFHSVAAPQRGDGALIPIRFRGMQQRVTIATELALRPALVILVEPPTAVDARVKRRSSPSCKRCATKHNTSYLLISHDIHLVRSLADRVGVLQAGRIGETGETERVLVRPSHACTRSLMDSIPRPHAPTAKKACPSGKPCLGPALSRYRAENTGRKRFCMTLCSRLAQERRSG